MKREANDFGKGLLIGIANIIPGISGGTFALILGIYDRLIASISAFTLRRIGAFVPAASRPWRAASRRRFMELAAETDLWFLARVVLGALSAIVLTSSLMEYLLIHHREGVYGFFLGLILFSAPIPYRMIRKKGAVQILAFCAAAALTVWISAAVDPSQKALEKSALLAGELADGDPLAEGLGPASAGYLVFCGVLSISAMVLPGISGSFVLILLGEYFTVVASVSGVRRALTGGAAGGLPHDLGVLCWFVLGSVAGLAAFVRLVRVLLRRYPDGTLAFLTGLIFGSLYTLWPFKTFIVADLYERVNGAVELVRGVRLYTQHNYWPSAGGPVPAGTIAATVICFAAGCLIMAFFDAVDRRSGRKKEG